MARNRRRLTPREIEQEYAVFEEKDVVHKNRLTLVKNLNQLHLTLSEIKPRTYAQTQAFESWFSNKNLVLAGSAGTGKSFIALYLALKEVIESDNKNKQVVVIRSAVQTRDIGHTPGSLEEKESLYKKPYIDLSSQLFHNPKAWEILELEGRAHFQTTSFIRGLTFNDTIMILDEVQDMTLAEIDSVMTRVGKGSRIIVCGDKKQCDLNPKKEKTGFDDMIRIMERMSEVDIVNFLPADIVRSGWVRDWIVSREELGI